MRNKILKGIATILLITLISFLFSGCIGESPEEIKKRNYKKGDVVTIVNSSTMCNCAVNYYSGREHINLICEDEIKRMYNINIDTSLISKCFGSVPKQEVEQGPIPITL